MAESSMGRAQELRFPNSKQHPWRVKFKLLGQTIHDLEVANAIDWTNLAQRGKLMADIGRGIADSFQSRTSWEHLDIKYTFAPVALRRSPTPADIMLARCGLVLIDAKKLLGCEPDCPRGHKGGHADQGYHTNASSAKGDSVIHTWYLLPKKRVCKTCKDLGKDDGETMTFLDNDPDVIKQLPAHLQQLMPVVKTPKSGLATSLVQLLISLSPLSVSHSAIVQSFNELQRVTAAEDELALLCQYQAALQDKPDKIPDILLTKPVHPKDGAFWSHFSLDLYPIVAEHEINYFKAWQKTFTSHIVRLDAGFKLYKDGMVTMVSGEGIILGVWLGTSGFTILLPHFAAVDLRCAALGKNVRLCYVDNPGQTAAVLKAGFRDLGSGLCPGDSGVRGDLFHMIDLIKDTTVLNHPSWPEACKELMAIFTVDHPGDRAALLRAKQDPKSTDESYVRKLMPPPHVLLPGLTKWAKKWFQAGMDTGTGKRLFSLETAKVIKNIMGHICKWYFSDAWMPNADGVLVPYNMYFTKEEPTQDNQPTQSRKPQLPVHFSMRNTSSVEAWHHSSNDLVSGSATKDSHIGTLVPHKVGIFNYKRQVKLGRMTDYKHSNLSILSSINKKSAELNLPVPYPDILDPEDIMVDFNEKQGLAWKDAYLTEGGSSLDAPEFTHLTASQQADMREQAHKLHSQHAAAVKQRAPQSPSVKPEYMLDVPPSWMALSPDKHQQPVAPPPAYDYLPDDVLAALIDEEAAEVEAAPVARTSTRKPAATPAATAQPSTTPAPSASAAVTPRASPRKQPAATAPSAQPTATPATAAQPSSTRKQPAATPAPVVKPNQGGTKPITLFLTKVQATPGAGVAPAVTVTDMVPQATDVAPAQPPPPPLAVLAATPATKKQRLSNGAAQPVPGVESHEATEVSTGKGSYLCPFCAFFSLVEVAKAGHKCPHHKDKERQLSKEEIQEKKAKIKYGNKFDSRRWLTKHGVPLVLK